ncbi:MAG: hypothetical protein AAF231_06465 [Pseudomonadota bacterium]
MQAAQTLVYLVYGSDPQYQQELSYSVLSACRAAHGNMDDINTLLFCDEANQRPDLPVTSYVMSDTERHDWTFGNTYNHALKIFALRKALELSGGKVCFVDTDTAFLQDPQLLFDRISDRTAVVHHNEGLLSQRARWSELLQNGWGTLIDMAPAAGLADVVHAEAPMYNSGLIGVMADKAGLLEQAAQLAHDLYQLEPVFNIEQFAVGATLGQTHDVETGQDLVDHYCGYRRFVFHRQIPDALATLNGDLSPQAATRLPVISDLAKPLHAKLRAHLNARLHGRGATYRYAYLCYLCSCAAKSVIHRQIWADIALDMIGRTPDRALARRVFRRFTPEALPASGLDAAQQKAWNSFWQATDSPS